MSVKLGTPPVYLIVSTYHIHTLTHTHVRFPSKLSNGKDRSSPKNFSNANVSIWFACISTDGFRNFYWISNSSWWVARVTVPTSLYFIAQNIRCDVVFMLAKVRTRIPFATDYPAIRFQWMILAHFFIIFSISFSSFDSCRARNDFLHFD